MQRGTTIFSLSYVIIIITPKKEWFSWPYLHVQCRHAKIFRPINTLREKQEKKECSVVDWIELVVYSWS